MRVKRQNGPKRAKTDKASAKVRKPGCWVLVETVQLYRRRYLVETPEDKPLWALDTVVMEEASPFSEVRIGEPIVSWRKLDVEKALKLAEEDGVEGEQARRHFHLGQD